jgi:putative Mg2+ transporter-C (MgtC) family protein
MDLSVIVFHLSRLALAFVLALPVAWDRERAERTLGLRTFPLVAMASTGYLLLAQTVAPDDASAQARFFQGLMTGIGFLGGGAIVKRGLNVHGTATAASIWNTAAVGAAVAYGLFEIAILLSAVNFAVLRWLGPIKDKVQEDAASADE